MSSPGNNKHGMRLGQTLPFLQSVVLEVRCVNGQHVQRRALCGGGPDMIAIDAIQCVLKVRCVIVKAQQVGGHHQ